MKRARQDDLPTQPSSKPSFDDASGLILKIKTTFHTNNEPEKFNMFLKILHDFHREIITVKCVSEQIHTLLKGHEDLFLAFWQFMPEGAALPSGDISLLPEYSTDPSPSSQFSKLSLSFIAPPIPDSPPPTPANSTKHTAEPSFSEAKDFVKHVKQTFINNPTIYKQFLQILQEHHQNQYPIHYTTARVDQIFEGWDDLKRGFRAFLPDPAQNITNHGYTSANFPSQPVGCTLPPIQITKGPTAPVSMTNALNFLDAVRIQKPTVYNEFLALMKNWKTQQISTEHLIMVVDRMFADNHGLLQGFRTFLPPGY